MQALRVHQYHSLRPGPRLLVMGAVHGNETCGSVALKRAVQWLDAGHVQLVCGSLTLIPVANPLAHANGTREGDRNLNRLLVRNPHPVDYEDHVGQALLGLFAQHDVLLDLHSFRAQGQAFVMLGPRNNTGTLEPFSQAQAESALARALGPTRMVEGWMATYADYCAQARQRGDTQAHPDLGVGTTEAMRRLGGYGVTLECGNHLDPQAPEVAWNALWRTLEHLHMLDAPVVPRADPARQFNVLQLQEVLVCEHASDRLARPWQAFDPFSTGELLAVRHDAREVRSRFDGCVVFPSTRAEVGEEWMYLARHSDRFESEEHP